MKLKSFLKEKTPKLYESLRRLGIRILPLPLGLMIINFIFQRLFRINGRVKWMVHFTSYVSVSRRIQIGKEVWKSFASSGGCYIQGANGMIIGDYTIFAPGVKVISGNHDPSDMGKWLPDDPLEIGIHCWIGSNAVILPGVKLGDRCIVGAGAVVTKSFPARSIVAGVPARLVATNKER